MFFDKNQIHKYSLAVWLNCTFHRLSAVLSLMMPTSKDGDPTPASREGGRSESPQVQGQVQVQGQARDCDLTLASREASLPPERVAQADSP